MEKKLKISVFLLSMCGLFGNADSIKAADQTAASCSQADVQAAVYAVQDSGGGTVTLPACDVTWDGGVQNRSNSNHSLTIVGQGQANTIIRQNTAGATTFDFTYGSASYPFTHLRFSNIGFYGRSCADEINAPIAIYTFFVDDLWIDNCVFYESAWSMNGLVSMKRVNKGLLYNNQFHSCDYSPSTGTYYGIQLGENTETPPKPTDYNYDAEPCSESANPVTCEASRNAWLAWYEDPISNNGIAWDTTPGTADKTIIIEDNVFYWKGPVVEANWANRMSVTFRHNTVYQKGTNGSNPGVTFKSGSRWFEAYDNSFICIPGSYSCSRGIHMEANGMFYNNLISGFNMAGGFWPIFCSSDYKACTPGKVGPTAMYIYGNTITNPPGGCVNPQIGIPPFSNWWGEGNCWGTVSGSTRITWLANHASEIIHYHAPQSGDAIYPYTAYPYPHPMRGSGDTTAPGAPSGLIVI